MQRGKQSFRLCGAVQPRVRDREQSKAETLDPVAAEIRRVREEELRDSLHLSPPPDQAGRISRVARQAGVPPIEVEDRLEDTERDLQAKSFVELARQGPMGMFALRNPRAAAVMQDDTESLGIIGTGWDFLKKAPGRLTSTTLWNLGSYLNSTFGVVEDINSVVSAPIYYAVDAFADAAGIGWIDAQKVKEREQAERARRDAWYRDNTAASAGRNRGSSFVSEGLLAGFDSLGLTALAIMTRDAKLGATVVGTISGSHSYNEALHKGLSTPAAIQYGVMQGTTEAVTEMAPTSTLIDMALRRAPVGRGFIRHLGQEMVGEQIATAQQDLTDLAMLPENRGKTLEDYISERPARAAQTALGVLTGTSTTSGGIYAAQRATDAAVRVVQRSQQAREAQQDQAALDMLVRGVEASKARARDPEVMRELLRQQAEDAGAADLFVPAEVIREFQQSDGYLAENDPFADYDVEGAFLAGGDVIMPIEDALTDLVGTPAWAAIRNDVRLSPGGMSARQSQEFNDSITDVMTELSDRVEELERSDRQQQTIRERLTDRVAEMFGVSYAAPAARSISEIFAQRLQTRAARLGQELTGDELDGFSVRQILPEGVAEAVRADGLDVVINAMRTRKDVAYGVGPSLLEFIRQRGGINDTGGDLAAMGLPRRYLSGFDERQVDLTDGLSGAGDYGVDTVLRAAIEAGFFPELANVENEQGPSTLDTQVLLDAIASELAGHPAFAEVREDASRRAGEELRQLLEEAGYSPDEMTDAAVREVVAELDEAQTDAGRWYDQAKSATRYTPVERNGNMVLPVIGITTPEASFAEAKAAYTDTVKDASAEMLTGEKVSFTQARKAVFSKSDAYRPALRFTLIEHLPQIVASSASYATTTQNADQGHSYIHAVAQVLLNGQPISVRLVLKDVGDGTLRQYQFEGFEVTAVPTGNLRSEDLGSRAPATAATRTVSEVVSDFNGRQLFSGERGRIIFLQNERIIELFQSRDLSTAIHEIAHMWAEELQHDAALPDAPEQLKADWETVKQYFAANGHAIGEDGVIPVDAHELFARSGERYFMEGKAPNSALARLFETFRGWLVNIYKSVDRLRAPISPEIREVFDRMIATDAEIAEAQERQALTQAVRERGRRWHDRGGIPVLSTAGAGRPCWRERGAAGQDHEGDPSARNGALPRGAQNCPC